MAQMKQLWENINWALDTYKGAEYKSCEEIADELKCPVEWVHEIVEQRWEETIGK